MSAGAGLSRVLRASMAISCGDGTHTHTHTPLAAQRGQVGVACEHVNAHRGPALALPGQHPEAHAAHAHMHARLELHYLALGRGTSHTFDLPQPADHSSKQNRQQKNVIGAPRPRSSHCNPPLPVGGQTWNLEKAGDGNGATPSGANPGGAPPSCPPARPPFPSAAERQTYKRARRETSKDST